MMSRERFEERKADVERGKLALREKDIDALCAVFARFPEVREVRVFGSRATGSAQRASDVDLAVTAPDMSQGKWARLIDALEEAPIIHFIDALRVDTLRNERLCQKIDAEGVVIYIARD
jgi:predicted nucleotidyltransferase